MARTERIRRKDLRQPDEFITLSRRAVTYAEENRTVVILATAAIVLAVVAVFAYRAIRSSREGSAAQAYARAHALLDDRKYAEAASAFQDVASSYGSTNVAGLAQLAAANALLLADRPADAAATYQAFLDRGAPTEYLRQVALTHLAAARENAGQTAEALAAYAAAAEIAGPYTEEALAGQARNAEATGDAAGARALYEKLLERYPDSDRRELVTARLIALGWTPPAEEATVGLAEVPAAGGP